MWVIVSGVMFLGGLWVFCSLKEHLLVTLLSLEYMVLSVFLLLLLVLVNSGLFYGLLYLVMAACEGALGLSILVIMGRTHGGDYFSSLGYF